MAADAWLVLFIAFFWGCIIAWVKLDNWRLGKRWREGPSLTPVIPILPLLALGVGWILNMAMPWTGTLLVICSHLGYVAVTSVSIWLSSRRSGDDI